MLLSFGCMTLFVLTGITFLEWLEKNVISCLWKWTPWILFKSPWKVLEKSLNKRSSNLYEPCYSVEDIEHCIFTHVLPHILSLVLLHPGTFSAFQSGLHCFCHTVAICKTCFIDGCLFQMYPSCQHFDFKGHRNWNDNKLNNNPSVKFGDWYHMCRIGWFIQMYTNRLLARIWKVAIQNVL